MHPASFDYLAAKSEDEACAALAQDPSGTRILAGGQSLLPLLVRRLDRPRRLVCVTGITGLHGLYATPTGLQVGAAVTQRGAEQYTGIREFGILAQALPRVGKVTTRNRGTICGSLAHANPAAELGICLLALGGEIVAASSLGFRRIPAEEFFVAPHQTALRSDELLHTAIFHRPMGIGFFDEVTLRGAGDTPLLSAAVNARIADGEVVDIRIATGGAGQVPVLAGPSITAALHGRLDDAAVAEASRAYAGDLEFHSDAHCSAQHRRRLATRVVARLLERVRRELP
ncbi:FAD binding domain-containing protein [Mycobacterium bourgelatii]|uniref:Carbon monoxide dehydrogenase n=1 Tax=Mycobacterium bourgelatii TaxID=1273442 RepID=A0A7I9YJ77_MYCBU|nr:FAD binding domain-containing protein [Mycobacterium bourgelatii]MCV6975557.1 FAD binding domain-containing protein [Mycobacterium bourgelatii]GFG88572.1 carbon monoxide dehydrogenase [Mycobacterium bourgelatii]